MNQLLAIAFGGSLGAVLRFLVSSGIYQWLGRGFPFGTLAVNVIGSFLLGLLTEALIVQRISIAYDYRAAILVGFIGAFTTFSTFSLETLYLLEQGSLAKAIGNIFISVIVCIMAVWLGLLCSRALFYWSEGTVIWNGHSFPYALMAINALGAFLIGFIITLLASRAPFPETSGLMIVLFVVATFLLLSGMYLILVLIEQGYSVRLQLNFLLALFSANMLICLVCIWLGHLSGKGI